MPSTDVRNFQDFSVWLVLIFSSMSRQIKHEQRTGGSYHCGSDMGEKMVAPYIILANIIKDPICNPTTYTLLSREATTCEDLGSAMGPDDKS